MPISDKFHRLVQQLIDNNKTPTKNLGQLSTSQLTTLHTDPFSSVSPLQFNETLEDDAVRQLPCIQLAEAFLQCVQNLETIKLTPKGNIPPKYVKALYDLRIMPNKYIDEGITKLRGEDDFTSLNVMRILCEIGKLVKKAKGVLSLTKKGVQMLQKPADLYRELLTVYMTRYNWAYTEAWSYGVDDTGRVGCGLMLYELLQRGDTEMSNKYYSELYLSLFPSLISLYTDFGTTEAREKAASDFTGRFFHRFCQIFGLTKIVREIKSEKYDFTEEFFVVRSALASNVFRLNP
jgi:hypothetical protein